MKMLSCLAKEYPRSGIRRMFDLANNYNDVVSLCLGEPDFETPQHVCEAGKKAIDDGLTHYTANAGLPELREAIAAKYSSAYSLNCSPENVMITVGAMEGLLLAFYTVINPGDEVIVPDPCYPNYLGQIKMLGAKAIRVPLYEDNGFRLRAEDLEKCVTPSTKALLLNSPSNPLGSMLLREDLEAIAKIVNRHNLVVVSDEVYEKIVYDGQQYCSVSQVDGLRERSIIVNSFSKSYAMTGWRLGYIVGRKDIIASAKSIQEGIVSCVPTFIQKAAVTALKGQQDDVQAMLAEYTRRRAIIVNGLNEISGIKCHMPPATFYVFPNIKAFGMTSNEFAEKLLREARVLTVPGSAFGQMGEGYLRISFATSEDNLKKAVKRISDFVRTKL